jgi:hypothetical protein
MRLCGDLCQSAKQKPRQDHDILVSRTDTALRRFGGLEVNPETSHQSHQGTLQYLRGIQQVWPTFPRTHNALSAATTGGSGSTESSQPSPPTEIRGGSTDYNAARTKTARGAVTTRPTEAATQPTMGACAWIQLGNKKTSGGSTCCVLPTRPSALQRRICTTLGRFPEMATSIARGPIHQGSATPRCQEHQVFPRPADTVSQHVGATATILVAAHLTRISPERTYGQLLQLQPQDLV